MVRFSQMKEIIFHRCFFFQSEAKLLLTTAQWNLRHSPNTEEAAVKATRTLRSRTSSSKSTRASLCVLEGHEDKRSCLWNSCERERLGEKRPGGLHFKAPSSILTSERRPKLYSHGTDISRERPGFGINGGDRLWFESREKSATLVWTATTHARVVRAGAPVAVY